MTPFLEHTAKDILSKYGTDLSRTAVVFPNKRASLFLNDALARFAGQPLWSPAAITISELFRQHADLQVADPIKLVCDLHKTYTEITGFDETLDHFYGWGQLLIADFDDIDKNMTDVDKLFTNLSNIRELDDVGYLSEEQREAIKKFFSNFTDDHNTMLKERFLRLWSRMGDIYHAFNRRLAAQRLAYEGALYRQVANDDALSFQYERYLFIGFNLLQQVEQRLFTRLKKEGKAFFYWDYDRYYLKSEAGHFIGQYLSSFPNELPDNDDIYQNFKQPKSIRLISASTSDVQARYTGQWLNEKPERISDGRRTAIVLCDESLLPAVVHSLPDNVTSINITTGYPLWQTAVTPLVMQKLRNTTLEQTIDYVKQLAADAPAPNDPLTAEACFRAYTLLTRLKNLIDSGDLPPAGAYFQPLVTYLFQQTTIPFHGEPVEGLQVMGMLETRGLDFDHLLLISANEGNLPRGINDSSFLPYSLRRAFGLTTADHKAAIYAYYFNRLVSRASDVTVVYSNATVDGQTSEMSRFMQQLLVEDHYHNITRHTLQSTATNAQPSTLSLLRSTFSIDKTPAVVDILRKRFSDSILSPTAVNRYMRCPLQFYFCYVEGLREPDDTDEGIIDNRVFGNIFHNAAEHLYTRLKQQNPEIKANQLDELLKTRVDIERAVDKAFDEEFKGQMPTGGLAVINREVIIHYLRQLVEVDRRLAPFTILKLEEDVLQRIPVRSLGITVTIGGRVDRLDCINTPDGGQQVRVIDYKTSAARLHPLKSVDDIFDDAHLSSHSDYYLQTFLYARIVQTSYKKQETDCNVAPALLFIQHASADDYNPILKFGNEYINDVATPDGDRFVRLLMEKIDEIFAPDRPFVPTADADRCLNCPYLRICGL